MSEMTPEVEKYVVDEFLAAIEIYKASNPLVRNSSKNFYACVEIFKQSNLAPEHFHRNAYLSALAQCAANGTLDRDLNENEKAERTRRINAEREARDRAPGNAGTPRGHMSQDEQDKLEKEANQNLLNNIRALKERVKADTTAPEAQEELSAADCLYALTGGDPKTPLTREKVGQWLKAWPSDLCRSVRRRQENIRQRMDEVLKTGVDPMIGVDNG